MPQLESGKSFPTCPFPFDVSIYLGFMESNSEEKLPSCNVKSILELNKVDIWHLPCVVGCKPIQIVAYAYVLFERPSKNAGNKKNRKHLEKFEEDVQNVAQFYSFSAFIQN